VSSKITRGVENSLFSREDIFIRVHINGGTHDSSLSVGKRLL